MDIQVFRSGNFSVSQQPVEYVERKGLGHPDSICDSVMESAAQALRAAYRERCGRVLHHNLDKALLVAGQSESRLGGGRIISPIQIIAGDRATADFGDIRVDVDEIVESAVSDWLRDNLRLIDVQQHLLFRSEIKPGSEALAGIFDRAVPVANDTSAAVGFAPLTETERIVLESEQYINSRDFKQQYPVTGEDVKVMAVRHGQRLQLTIAVAMVDRFVKTEADYFEQKAAICSDVTAHIRSRLNQLDLVSVDINTLDDPKLGQAGMYLTVIGTSAENGDGGQVGRGNAVNGLISLCRPTSNEAAAGKNTVCHVGNIYNHLSHKMAGEIVESIDPVQECYVWLCSQIGRPVDEPLSTSISLVLDEGTPVSDVADEVTSIIDQNLRAS